MIDINLDDMTYVCPYCGCKQSFTGNYSNDYAGYEFVWTDQKETDLEIYHIKCANKKCMKITCVARELKTKKQIDIFPKTAHKIYPDYIPKQIRDDYTEAISIIQDSPKASATLLRRCLQGMIRDFWGIKKGTLKAEIDELQSRISKPQWEAIDGLRSIGNIGAHMEKDINLIIDIDEGEAAKLVKLIELLIDKWYIARHDEESLYKEITDTATSKKEMK